MSDFDLFGSDSEPEESSASSTSTKTTAKRLAENGVFSSHMGTEMSLLLYVKRTINLSSGFEASPDEVRSLIVRAENVLEVVDTYCKNIHWMMHIGPLKKRDT